MPLNDLLCKNAKPRLKHHKLFDAQGLYLEVSPSGRKYWYYKYSFDNKEKRLAIGVYPAVSLKEARLSHEQAMVERKRGNDPITLKKMKKQQEEQEQEKKREEEEQEKIDTLEKVTREYVDWYKRKWKPKYAREIIGRFEKHIFPGGLGNVPIKKVTTTMLDDRLEEVAKQAPHIAKRIKQKLVKVFRYAKRRKKVPVNIALDLDCDISTKRPVHRASIDIDELPEFLAALKAGKEILDPISYWATRIMLKTFSRRKEFLRGEWAEVSFDNAMWTIPPERMKMGLEHLVPLSRQTIADLRELYKITGNSKYLFPNFTTPNKPIRLTIILEALEQIGYKGKMSTHGFRALAMGVCKERLKYRHEVPDRQLAHIPESEIRQAYDRAKYLDERIEMMQNFANYLDNPTQPQPTQRTAAYDRTATAFKPNSYQVITTSYRIQHYTGGSGLPSHL